MKKIRLLILLLFSSVFAFGQAVNMLSFNGINQYVVTPGAVIPTSGDFTVSVWAKNLGALSGNIEILSQGASGNAFYIGYSGTTVRLGDTWASAGNYPNDNAWHNFTVVKTATNAYLYTDGVLTQTHGSTIANPAPTTFRIAQQYGDQFSEYWNGGIDEVKVWNRALSSCEVSATYKVPFTGKEQGLLAYYSFDETTGTTLTDLAGANNGTLMNTPTWAVSDNATIINGIWLAVSTTGSSSITQTSAKISGDVTFGTATESGVVYNSTGCPSTADFKLFKT